MAAAITYTDTQTANWSSGAVSFSVATGSAAADRITVIGLTWLSFGDITTVKLDGVDMTRVIAAGDVGDNNMYSAIYQIANPTGTSSTLACTATLFGYVAPVVANVWSITGTDLAASDSDSSTTVSSDAITITGLTVPSGGVGVAHVNGNNTTLAVAWTGATERSDAGYSAGVGAYRVSGADLVTAGTNNIIATFDTGVISGNLVGAAWQAAVTGPAGTPMRGLGLPGFRYK